MSKKIIFSGIALLVVVIISLLVFSGKEKAEKESISENGNLPTLENKETKIEKLPLAGNDTIQSLISRGKNLECKIVFNKKEADGSTNSVEGNVFTSDGQVRGDFMIAVNEKPVVSSFIMKDKAMYTWSEIEGKKYGLKIDMEEVEKLKKENNVVVDSKEPVSLDENVQYECKDWAVVDRSVFEAPTDIVFSEYNQVMNRGMEYGSLYEEGEIVDKKNACSMCEQVTDKEAKKQCLVNFSCN